MEEQKLSILQRDKINYILRSGESLPISKRHVKSNDFPAVDLMRERNARRRTLEVIKASGGYERARYLPKSFESTEMKKMRLQETMSGLKHHFSVDDKNHAEKTSNQLNDDGNNGDDINPVDECNK